MTMKPFDDKRVRQAFNYAINRDHLAQLGYGTMLPAKGPLPPGMPGYNPELRGYPYDPAKAKAVYSGMTPLSADDVADAILWAIDRPKHVNIQEIVVYPTDQATVGVVHRRPEASR